MFVVVLVVWEVGLPVLGRPVVPDPAAERHRRRSCVADWPTLWRGLVFTGTEAVGRPRSSAWRSGPLAGFATARWATAREILLPVAIGASTIPIIAFAPITLNWFGPESLLPRMTIVGR